MWPQNGDSNPQVDLDTAAERASKYLSFSYECWFQSVPQSMCTMDDCISSRSGYFYLKSSISSLIRSIWIGIHSPWHNEDGSSYLTVQLPTVTTEVLWRYLRFLFWKQYHQHPFQEITLFEVDTAVEKHIAILRRFHRPLAARRARRLWYLRWRNFVITYFHIPIKTFNRIFSFLGIPFSIQLRIIPFCLFNFICLRHATTICLPGRIIHRNVPRR